MYLNLYSTDKLNESLHIFKKHNNSDINIISYPPLDKGKRIQNSHFTHENVLTNPLQVTIQLLSERVIPRSNLLGYFGTNLWDYESCTTVSNLLLSLMRLFWYFWNYFCPLRHHEYSDKSPWNMLMKDSRWCWWKERDGWSWRKETDCWSCQWEDKRWGLVVKNGARGVFVNGVRVEGICAHMDCHCHKMGMPLYLRAE